MYENYKNRWYSREDVSGISVVRVKTYIAANEGFVKRILDYMSFMASAFIAGIFQKKVDILIATSPQFFTAVSGCMLSKCKRIPFVFELRDIWPASITAVGAMEKGVAISLLERLEMYLYRQAHSIICVTNSFRTELISRGIDSGKISVALNGVNLDDYKDIAVPQERNPKLDNLSGKFTIGYIGTHGLAHGLLTIVDTAVKLRERDDIRFLFVGGGAAKKSVDDYVAKLGLKNVVSIDRVPKLFIPYYLQQCDVSIVHLQDNPLFASVIPSKIFESMALGIPLLMAIPRGEATDMVESQSAGLIANPEDAEHISQQLLRIKADAELYTRLSEGGVRAAAHYSRSRTAESMLKTLISLRSER
ncbi:MAG: glycosyltransferase WbuB [Nitrospirales bacterium]|nr:MAG: glycosyltransferase WbuB [Nitrospirales bacterium]